MVNGHNKVTFVFRYDQQEPRYLEVTQINGPDCSITNRLDGKLIQRKHMIYAEKHQEANDRLQNYYTIYIEI